MKKHLLKGFLRILYVGLANLALATLARAQPVITSFSPESGPPGTPVTLVGTGFNANAESNVVFFGPTKGNVLSATNNTLTVEVPYGATYRSMGVLDLSTNLSGYSMVPFAVTQNTPGLVSFMPRTDVPDGAQPRLVAVGDFDQDGLTDFAVANGGASGTVSIFRNMSTAGSMSVSLMHTLDAGDADVYSLAVGMLDGDGWPDLAMAIYGASSGTISVFRNTTSAVGSISFSAIQPIATGANPASIAIADLDLDGKPDLAVSNLFNATLSVFRNGSISGSIAFGDRFDISVGSQPFSLAAGFLDDDNRPDIIVGNRGDSNLSIFFNTSLTGSISFGLASNVSVNSNPRSVAIGDLDLDGQTDIAVATESGMVSLLRNTITSPGVASFDLSSVSAGSMPYSVAIGDLNGDGKPELSVANRNSNNVSYFENNSSTGSLTFSHMADVATGAAPTWVAIADLNNDAKLDLIVANFDDNSVSLLEQMYNQSLSITSSDVTSIDGSFSVTVSRSVSDTLGGTLVYSVAAGSGSATVDPVTGYFTATHAGTVTLSVMAQGDSNYLFATANQVITIGQVTPTLMITSSNTMPLLGSMTASFTRSIGDDRGGVATFSVEAGSGSATVDPVTGLINALGAGSFTLTVSTAGDSDYLGAIATQEIFVTKITPTLSFGAATNLSVGDSLTATISSTALNGEGGAYSYVVVGGSGSATIDSNSGYLTALNAGTVTIMVNAAGDTNYNTAELMQEITIDKATPTLTITSANTIANYETLTATVSSTAPEGRGGLFSYAIEAGSGSATIDPVSGFINALGAGTVTLIVTSAGDTDFNSASVTQELTISENQMTPTLTITSGNTVNVDGGLTVTVVSTAAPGMGGAISYILEEGSGSATIDASTGYLVGVRVGTLTVTATSAGDSDYRSASVSQLITVGQVVPQLFVTSPDVFGVDEVVTASFTSTANGQDIGEVTYGTINDVGAAIIDPSSGQMIALSIGHITLTINTAGNDNYAPAYVEQSIEIVKGTPTISVVGDSLLPIGGLQTVMAFSSASFGRGGDITFDVIAGSGSATIDPISGEMLGISTGTVTVTATSAGDDSFNPVMGTLEVLIGQLSPVLSITSADTLNVGESLTATAESTAPVGEGGDITFSVEAGSGSATVDAVSGYLTAISAGTVTLVATSAGDTVYYSVSVRQEITIGKSSPSLSITSANSMNVGESLSLTVETTAPDGRGGAYSYQIVSGSGSATVDANGILTAIGAGSITVEVTSAGDTDYYSATISQEITIGKSSPSLSITSANTMNVGESLSLTVETTAPDGRGGAYSYNVVAGSGSATLDANGILTAIGAGSITVEVTSAGDTDYYSATISQEITIGKSSPSLSITSANTMNVGESLSLTVETTAPDGQGGAYSYNVIAGSGSATIDANGILTAINAGSVTVEVVSAGDDDYYGATASQEITIGKMTPTISITSADNMPINSTLTATITTNLPLGAGGYPVYSIEAGTGLATVDSNTGVITSIAVGTVSLTVTIPGDANYYGASASQLITINMITPTLTIISDDEVAVDSAITLTVSSTVMGGGDITYSLEGGSGSATLDANTGMLIGVHVGTVTVTATSAGDTSYFPSSASKVIAIVKASPSLTITSANAMSMGESISLTVETTATNGRGGAYTYNVVAGSGSATIDANGILTAINAGSVTVEVVSAGDDDYYGATASQEITIGKMTPTISITSADNMPINSTLTATITTNLPLGAGGYPVYSIEAGTGLATVDSNTGVITSIAVGTVSLTVTIPGDANYYGASASQLITINMITPTLTIISDDEVAVDSAITLTVSSTVMGGGDITYSLEGGSGSATLDANTGMLIGVHVGTVTVTATSAGDTSYSPSSASKVITVVKSTPTLVITSSDEAAVDQNLNTAVSHTSSHSVGTYSYSIGGGSGIAIVNGAGVVIPLKAGTVTLTVTSSGNDDYYDASVTQLITIGRGTPVITLNAADAMHVGETGAIVANSSASLGRGGAITFQVINDSGSAVVMGDYITATGTGAVTLVATSAGDADFYPATAEMRIDISGVTPTLTITSATDLDVDGTLQASVSSTAPVGQGGDIFYTIEPGSGLATVDASGLITGVSAGTATLIATSFGDGNYLRATTSVEITIHKITQTIQITSSNHVAVEDALTITATSSATGGRGGALSYDVEAGSGSATVDAMGVLHAINVGTVTVTVTAAGDNDYYGNSVSQLITIGRTTPTIVITSANTIAVDGTMTITYTSSAANPGTVSYGGQNSTGIVVAVANTGKVTAVQVGAAVVKVTTAGTANYYPVTASMSMTILKATPTLTITAPSGSTMVNGTSLTVTFNTSATYNRGGAKSYAVSAGSGSATINATTGKLTAVSPGSIILTVSTAGDANYNQRSLTKTINITSSMLAVAPMENQPAEKFAVMPDDAASAVAQEQAVAVSMAVSPNGDGLNDVLAISRIENHPDNELVISNRAGELVFKAHGYDNGAVVFDGRSNTGAPLADGVYYYTLVYYDHGKMVRHVGYFELKR